MKEDLNIPWDILTRNYNLLHNVRQITCRKNQHPDIQTNNKGIYTDKNTIIQTKLLKIERVTRTFLLNLAPSLLYIQNE